MPDGCNSTGVTTKHVESTGDEHPHEEVVARADARDTSGAPSP
jgi:hypothetical protein